MFLQMRLKRSQTPTVFAWVRPYMVHSSLLHPNREVMRYIKLICINDVSQVCRCGGANLSVAEPSNIFGKSSCSPQRLVRIGRPGDLERGFVFDNRQEQHRTFIPCSECVHIPQWCRTYPHPPAICMAMYVLHPRQMIQRPSTVTRSRETGSAHTWKLS